MSDFVAERNNLGDWDTATRTGGTASIEPSYIRAPTPAAQEILNDPFWAEKMRRVLAASGKAPLRSIKEYRENL